MTQKDKLFVLIKSLTFGEKAYFSKYSRTHAVKEKPDYLRLFEFIEAQEEYNEAAIRKHFKGDNLIKHLPRKKSQLKDKIIESLSLFHADRTVELSLRRQMNVLGVLCEKAIYHRDLAKEFEKQIIAIKKIAQEREAFTILIELAYWEEKLISLWDDKSKKEAQSLDLIQDVEKYQQQFSQETQLENMARRLSAILSIEAKIVSPSYKIILDSLFQRLPSEKSLDTLSKKARSYYFYIKSNYLRVNGEPKKAHKYTKKRSQLHADTLEHTYESLVQYKYVLCCELIAADDAKIYDGFFETLEKMKSCGKGDEDMRTLNTVLFKSLMYWMSQLKLDEASKVADEVAQCHKELFPVVYKRRRAAYCYNLMITYWLTGQLDKAVHWLNQLFINYEQSKEAKTFVYQARILQLPLYRDYADKHLSNRIESARRVLAERGRLFEFEEVVIACFRKLIRCVNSKEELKVISNFHDNLMEFREKYPNRVTSVWECMKVWCEIKGVVPEHLYLIHEIRNAPNKASKV